MTDPARPGVRDPWLWIAVVVGLLLRWTPHAIWGVGDPIRDEALYLQLARRITAGGGMGAPKSWLWAPGYPYFLAFFRDHGPGGAMWTVPWVQGVLGALTCLAMYALAVRVHGDRRSARWAAWLYAVHPTLVFFAGRLWCEAVYGPMLLFAVLALLWARDGSWARMAVPGALLGLCVLTRGVATYLPLFFAVAAAWPDVGVAWREGARARARHVAVLLAVVVLVVAPYSIHATRRYGSFVINDATLGNLMYLGNNEFEPLTFDYGNGILRNLARHKNTRQGRRQCKDDDPIAWNACETENGFRWIRENPGEFLRRVPLRVAQLVNPHSFATRSLRWARYRGLPFWAKEGLIVWIAAWSFVVLPGGTVAAAARARGPYGWLACTIVAYTVAASAATYGLTRFRVPLEPLWMVFLAGLLASPRVVLAELAADRRRLLAAVVLVPLLVAHMMWFLPTAWPGFGW